MTSTTYVDATGLLPDGATAWNRPELAERWAEFPGVWDFEPDKVSWTDPTTGRPCLIVRNPSGALCGYVAVDPGHPFYEVDYSEVDGYSGEPLADIDVHGGLTYSGLCQDGDDEGKGICHVPEPGAPDRVWWFGFDCAHAGDFVPGHAATTTRLGPSSWVDRGDVYRDVRYVRRHCERLARQLVAVETPAAAS